MVQSVRDTKSPGTPAPTTATEGAAAKTNPLRGMSYDDGAKALAPGGAGPAPAGPAPAADQWAAKIADPTVLLRATELTQVSYAQLLAYLDTRPKSHVETLRTDARFLAHAESLGAEQFANVVVRILLRTPESVVNRGASQAEAIRILTSQLRDPEVCRNLLANEAYVVIIPQNKLMTDFAEFAQWKGTYTFDGRPWDITRGMGGVPGSKNTAIAEENLLGTDVDPSTGRMGWASQGAMDAAVAGGKTEKNEGGKDGPKKDDPNARMMNPGVYCSGYSTTNHEFFHTIHSLGLKKADSDTIQSEYSAKKGRPNTEEWADGPRQDQAGANSENYASSTVYEYFAQTGCAFQGTNVGEDPYTQRPRNNGRSWVEKHEPKLTTILSRVCSSSELKSVNPRDARAATEAAAKKTSTPTPVPPAPAAAAAAATKAPDAPVVGSNVAFIGKK